MSTAWTIAIAVGAGVAGYYIGRRGGLRRALGRAPAAGVHSIAPVIDPKFAAAAKITSAAAGTGQKV